MAFELLLLAFAALGQAVQPSAPHPIPAPLRELPWGQLQFLHTTDTHGWLGGHLQEPSFSSDWGDYVSFAKHMRDRADADGTDLLLVDTGDRIEGNGLYDGSKPKGKYIFDIFKGQDIDLLCSGNHELYKVNSSDNEFYETVPNFRGKYLASNLDIYNPKNGKLEPLAQRFKKFTTKNQKIRILSFGFLFDFTGNANNTVVHTVASTIKEDWFKEAIRDRDVDLILVFGHVAIRSPEYDLLFKTIRSEQWDTPIAFLGGHTHIRDYKKYDSKSAAMESGRYMETIGFMSVSGLSTSQESVVDAQNAAKGITFGRRYIDNNLFSLYNHSSTNSSTFPTELGLNVSSMISSARKELKLDHTLGCAPHDFYVNRAPFPAPDSIFSWLQQRVLPDYISASTRVANESKKAIVITNTGGIRFDIFKGPFTRDTEFLVSPFTSGLRYIADVKYESAKRVLELLNNNGPVLEEVARQHGLASWALAPPEQVSDRPEVIAEKDSFSDNLRIPHASDQIPLHPNRNKDNPALIPGYTTHDDLGTDGDDTVHSEISFYRVPNCIQADIGFSEQQETPQTVDLVYNAFIEPWVILALKFLGEGYGKGDTGDYMRESLTEVISAWVGENWGCGEEG
ncbi:hypothetical protein K402DRAFT_338023 [Aulographum hederae CBS 113979]|uniref:Uncharacterized protein n=1 Tax=Aulographum hederae CBS 113979 TaxID=1176131 RepID=A0A6G1GRK1_9PEZI|nr:hypothetical protein K402DRAFT_338023 [Aulographum hederae CBS 113979]